MGIKFKDVSYKDYIKNLNLDLVSNQVISIIGEEEIIDDFFDLIYGVDLPENGEIVVNKNAISATIDNKKLDNLRKNIAYLASYCDDILFNINVLEDIKYGLGKISDKKIYELLELLNLDDKVLNKNYTEISDSEKKKICLISALLKDSKITLLNNLTDSLDSKTRYNLVKFLRKEKRNNKIFVISDQNTDFLLQVSDSILVINEQGIKLENDKYSLFSNEKLINSFKISVPWVIRVKNKVLDMKNIKLNHRDNVNDLLKDIYRNATKVNK